MCAKSYFIVMDFTFFAVHCSYLLLTDTWILSLISAALRFNIFSCAALHDGVLRCAILNYLAR